MTMFRRSRQAWILAVAGFGSACSSDPAGMPTAAPSAVPGAASSLGRLPALDQLADYATRLREGDDGVVPLVIRMGRGAAPAIERAAAEALV
ncbi:MAG: hypothetical protein MUC36_28740, partial [Planctomycetes bacterium]|nr:hypothetical protein [Planctomycetota bacterium]